MCTSLSLSIYIYIYIYIHALRALARLYMGYCPIWSPYVGTPFCRDEQARDHTVWGESFGEASRCVMSNVAIRAM